MFKWETKKQLREKISLLENNLKRKSFSNKLYKEQLEGCYESYKELERHTKELSTMLKRTTTYKNKYANEVKQKALIITDLKKVIEDLSCKNEELNNNIDSARSMIEVLNKQVYMYKNRKDPIKYGKIKSERS